MLYNKDQGVTDKAKEIIIVTTVLGVLAIISVALRVYARVYSKLYLGIDEYLILLALFLSCGISVIFDYTAAVTGVGDPKYQPTLDATVFALKTNFACENAQIFTMGLIKVSILFFYRRIFGISPKFVRASNVLIVLISTFTLAIMLAVIFSKWPVYAQWDPYAPYNMNASAVLICYVVGNSAFDILTLALPIAAVQTLRMDQSKKLFMTVIFSLGSTCMAASLVRLYYAVKWVGTTATANSLFEAPFIDNILWAMIEPPVFIVVVSMLTMGPLLRNIELPRQWLRLLSTKTGGTAQTDETYNGFDHDNHSNSHFKHSSKDNVSRVPSSEMELLTV
ncbi:lactate/malate dehydrogenase alpha/beta C-terminal domain family protein [Penicillium odoratum]|uniref:lactate/malate dehydrogenase alpha/beta C-terminal domain family protein n=1 Tax=Penicillium odoratum TaxID=1167516 RepID=UPI002546EEAE|nr:lactate/malate dehydrogenase alpha/beta C-terminal domain family protein [Penicillium odoratum]KAJ5777170.1 lactate/malate dehydrogenase alpha/beta C-terminal domain family protein [Penicillium odoratum]